MADRHAAQNCVPNLALKTGRILAALTGAKPEFICFLGEKGIPIDLLPQAEDELEADEAIGTLKAHEFMTRRADSTSFDTHRLVRLAMRNWLASKGEQKKWFTEVIQRLQDVFPYPAHENRDKWMSYMPHVQTALELRESSTDKEDNSRLLHNVAESHSVLGRYQEAAQMYRQALELREKVLGKVILPSLSSD